MHGEVRPSTGYEHISIHPLSGALGAEIHGVDLAQISDDVFTEIHRVLDHLVIFFRDQTSTRPSSKRSSARNSPPVSNGTTARSQSGTTAASCIAPSPTTMVIDATCIES